jgi:hypothetical protein
MRESAGTLVFNAFPTGACEVGRTLPLVVRFVSIMSRTPYVMGVMGGPFICPWTIFCGRPDRRHQGQHGLTT